MSRSEKFKYTKKVLNMDIVIIQLLRGQNEEIVTALDHMDK